MFFLFFDVSGKASVEITNDEVITLALLLSCNFGPSDRRLGLKLQQLKKERLCTLKNRYSLNSYPEKCNETFKNRSHIFLDFIILIRTTQEWHSEA